jgi:hypothetical protein
MMKKPRLSTLAILTFLAAVGSLTGVGVTLKKRQAK